MPANNKKIKLPRLLWVRCGSTSELDGQHKLVETHFDLAVCTDLVTLRRDIRMLEPRVLCFEFNMPLHDQLQQMHRTKIAHPGIPVIMLTEAHSEDLAVWAFRSRVWNYMTRPVARDDLEESLKALATIAYQSSRGRLALQLAAHEAPRVNDSSHRFLANRTIAIAVHAIQRRYNEPLRESDLAQLCGVSKFRFSRLFHASQGITFREYLTRYRLAEACRRLQAVDASIKLLSQDVGFNDGSHFARLFRRHIGVTPRAYQGGTRPMTPESVLSVHSSTQTRGRTA